jgi:hypothetical protein
MAMLQSNLVVKDVEAEPMMVQAVRRAQVKELVVQVLAV